MKFLHIFNHEHYQNTLENKVLNKSGTVTIHKQTGGGFSHINSPRSYYLIPIQDHKSNKPVNFNVVEEAAIENKDHLDNINEHYKSHSHQKGRGICAKRSEVKLLPVEVTSKKAKLSSSHSRKPKKRVIRSKIDIFS